MSALFAIASAFLYALANVITRFGLRYASTSSGVLISLLFCFGSVLIYCLFATSLDQYLNRGVFFFLAAGIIGPFFGRLLLYIGMERVGTAISSTLYENKPLFAVIAAVIVLGETLSLPIFLGLFLMMAGTAIVSLEKSGGQIERKWSKKDLIFPLTAGACYGVSHALRKLGLNITPSPVVGVMAQNIGAIAFVPILALTRMNRENILSNNKIVLGAVLVVSATLILTLKT
jgi:drug/metabolite transporter (DMT)-like permease